jgi:hypothetical protein
MRQAKSTFFFICVMMAIACGTSKSTEKESIESPSLNSEIEITWQAWRNLMPSIDDSSDRSTHVNLEISLVDAINRSELTLDSICVSDAKKEHSWCTTFPEFQWNEGRQMMFTDVGGGPAWKPESKVSGKLFYTYKGKSLEKELETVLVMGAY